MALFAFIVRLELHAPTHYLLILAMNELTVHGHHDGFLHLVADDLTDVLFSQLLHRSPSSPLPSAPCSQWWARSIAFRRKWSSLGRFPAGPVSCGSGFPSAPRPTGTAG